MKSIILIMRECIKESNLIKGSSVQGFEGPNEMNKQNVRTLGEDPDAVIGESLTR